VREIYVVTHTESVHHVEGSVGGWYDTGLTERGQRQAEAVGERVAELLDGSPARVVTSDLARARETAERIAARLGVVFEETSDLREMSYGVAEGRPQAWLDERFVAPPEENRLDSRSIEGGETKRELATRVYRGMARILESDAAAQVVVTHGFALTFVVAAWVGMPLEAAGYINLRSTSGGITHLQEDDFFRNRAIRVLNETAHLEGI
jgi:probable phosphoglycerate mutase